MADPIKYVPGFSYSDWQAVNPKKPLPGDEVDNDFANVKRSMNETIDGLKDVRRSDGKLKNQSVGPDQLDPSLSLGFNLKGQWVDGEYYAAGDGVVKDGGFYNARVSHTTSAENAPPDDGYWNFLFDVSDIAVAGALSMPRTSLVGDGVTKTFALDFTPNSRFNVIASVGGVIQSTDDYDVSAATITFNVAPGDDYAIEVRGFATTATVVTPADGSVSRPKLTADVNASLDKADTAAQVATIGAYALVKNRANYEWNVYDFAGADFTDKMADALQNIMEDNVALLIPSGVHVLEDLITLDGSTATRRVAIRGHGPLASRVRCQGGKIRVNLTAWGQIDCSDFWLDPVGQQVGNAPLDIFWSGMASSRGFRIKDVHIGATNAADNPTNWFENSLRINGKGTGLIKNCYIAGKGDLSPVTNGIQIDNAKEVDIEHCSIYHTAKGLFSTTDGSSISEGIKVAFCTFVNATYGVHLVNSTGLPDFELIHSHIAYNRGGVYLKGWTQNKIVDNLIYAENNSLETVQEDIYLETCPASIVSRNQFFSGLDKNTVEKVGLTLKGSSRNSRYEHNLFSERTVGIRLIHDGGSGIQDCVFENNRPERDLSGNKTVNTMVEVSSSALHTRNRWIGEDAEFMSTAITSGTSSLAQNTWTTVPFGAISGDTAALLVTAMANPGEYQIAQNGTTRGKIKAKIRVTTASSADAGIIGLRLMRNNGGGFTEIERVSAGGADVTLYLESREYAFAPGNQFRIEAFQSAAGSGTIQTGGFLEFYPVK